jgi:hypothetical protein
MAEPLRVKPVYELLVQYLRQRYDLGVGKGPDDCVLESSSRFDSRSRRSPKPWFVLLVLLAPSAFACFLYFNGLW